MRQAGRPACASGAPPPLFAARACAPLAACSVSRPRAGGPHARTLRARSSLPEQQPVADGVVLLHQLAAVGPRRVQLAPAAGHDRRRAAASALGGHVPCSAPRTRAPAHRRTLPPSFPRAQQSSARAEQWRLSGVRGAELPAAGPAGRSDRSIRRRAPVQCARTRASEQRGVLRCSLAKQTNPPTYPPTHPHGRVPPRRARACGRGHDRQVQVCRPEGRAALALCRTPARSLPRACSLLSRACWSHGSRRALLGLPFLFWPWWAWLAPLLPPAAAPRRAAPRCTLADPRPARPPAPLAISSPFANQRVVLAGVALGLAASAVPFAFKDVRRVEQRVQQRQYGACDAAERLQPDEEEAGSHQQGLQARARARGAATGARSPRRGRKTLGLALGRLALRGAGEGGRERGRALADTPSVPTWRAWAFPSCASLVQLRSTTRRRCARRGSAPSGRALTHA